MSSIIFVRGYNDLVMRGGGGVKGREVLGSNSPLAPPCSTSSWPWSTSPDLHRQENFLYKGSLHMDLPPTPLYLFELFTTLNHQLWCQLLGIPRRINIGEIFTNMLWANHISELDIILQPKILRLRFIWVFFSLIRCTTFSFLTNVEFHLTLILQQFLLQVCISSACWFPPQAESFSIHKYIQWWPLELNRGCLSLA